MTNRPRSKAPPPRREVVDQNGNVFVVASELSRGGQGVVFRTADGDIALKQPIAPATGQIAGSAEEFARKVENIRLLPMPEGIPVTLPLSTLREEPGYAMKLLSGMSPLTAFEPDGAARKAILGAPKPAWLANVEDPKMLVELVHYARTGGLRRRLRVLFRAASALARLHSAGIVYVDLSPNNVFAETGSIIGQGIKPVLEEYRIKTLLLGGQISKSSDLIVPALAEELQSSLRICPVSDFDNATFNGLLTL